MGGSYDFIGKQGCSRIFPWKLGGPGIFSPVFGRGHLIFYLPKCESGTQDPSEVALYKAVLNFLNLQVTPD